MSTAVQTASNDRAIHEEAVQAKLKHLQETVTANQNIQSIGPTPPSQVEFAEVFVWVKVDCNDKGFQLPSGAFAHFEGTAWGPGFGGGVSWMSATFAVPESDIFGDVSFSFRSSGGMTYLDFSRGFRVIGFAVGAGLGVSAGVFGGSGKFTKG